MDLTPFTAKKVEVLLIELGSRQAGLFRQEAQKRLKEFGPNKILARETGAWEIFLRQLRSPFIYLLLAAAILAFLLGEYSNTLMIAIFMLINTSLGFYQEYHSERTVKLLKQHFTPHAHVIREGQEEKIGFEELVPGDIVVLEPGDIIPADMRLIEAKDLLVDESFLTGESEPVEKTTEEIKGVVDEAPKAKNMAFSGTAVSAGQGLGLVVVTGKQTIFGKITKLTAETKRESVFEKDIKRFSRYVLWLVLITVVLMFLANILVRQTKLNIGELSLFLIALAVSVVPEALPLVTTFSFSRGALRLAKEQVVVKRLASVEDLGAIEILCVDKTGTLTENQMTVDELYSPQKEKVLLYAALGSSAYRKELVKNPFDGALFQALPKEESIPTYEKIARLPFDPNLRRDTTLVKVGKNFELISRGAPEVITKLCGMTEFDKKQADEWMVKEGKEGKRILAVGVKSFNQPPTDLRKAEKGLRFSGLISFVDPIKNTAAEAVGKAEKLGVVIKVLSGDRKEVAQTVAEQIGLIEGPSELMIGEEFEHLSAEKQRIAVGKIKVFARVSPQQKYKIIQLLQQSYEVGFLGDGINDAPAMKLANVALAVKDAADVTREAADIVLIKKDLKVIVNGIKEGREIFANTTKYIGTTLSANFGNFYAMAAASMLISYLPMLPIQILLVNLLSDFPMIAMATDNVDSQEITQPRRYGIKSIISLAIVLGMVSSIFDFMTFAIFAQWSVVVLQTSWFMESILSELAFIFTARTRRFFLKSRGPSWVLAGLAGVAAVVTVIVPWLSSGEKLFGFHRPTVPQIGIIMAIVVGYFISSEVAKLLYLRQTERRGE
jgi:Mg2+-importing ATPase